MISAHEPDAALGIAARSVLASRLAASTVESVVGERALEHQWAALHQYAVRHAGAQRAVELLAELQAWASHALLAREPGPRAQLVRHLRLLVRREPQLARPLAPDSPLYLPPRDPAHTARMVALRAALSPDLDETIELVHTRGLRPHEAALVLDLETHEVESRLAAAHERALEVLGARPPSRTRTVRGALVEAFALDPARVRAPARPPRPKILVRGDVIAGRYEVEEQLGSGGFAEVYRARDLEVSDHVVALKILRVRAYDADAVASALRELQLIASVFHPSIVQLKDHGWHDRRLWFVMPLYEGETLAQRIRRKPLARAEAREIFEPLANALAAMHRVGVRHQDVKPENVFLARIGEDATQGVLPVLLDLGVAARDAELVLAGTPTYFAPEVAARFAGDRDPPMVGPKADVFSLALTLRDALEPEGADTLIGGSVDAFVHLRAATAPMPPTGSGLEYLQRSFSRWLSVSPDGRPSAEEFARELAELTAPEERRARRHAFLRWALPSLVAALALFGAVTYALTREADLQRLEAERARAVAERQRERADTATASLTEAEARRRALESDVVRLEEQYESSRLTREELAQRLAQAEGTLGQLEQRFEEETQARRDAEAAAAMLREVQQRTVEQLDARRSEIAVERGRRERSEARVSEAQALVDALSDESQRAQARVESLERELRLLRISLSVPLPPPRSLER